GNPDYRRVQDGRAKLDGSIFFLYKDDPAHPRSPAIYIEPEGHGVTAAGPEVLQPGYQFPGVIYRLTGRGPQIPSSAQDPGASYELMSIYDALWARRFEVGTTYCCADNYSFP